MAYLIDANIFIEAKTAIMGLICALILGLPDQAREKGVVMSVKKVRDELMGRQDKLSLWCKTRSQMFVDTNDPKNSSLRSYWLLLCCCR